MCRKQSSFSHMKVWFSQSEGLKNFFLHKHLTRCTIRDNVKFVWKCGKKINVFYIQIISDKWSVSVSLNSVFHFYSNWNISTTFQSIFMKCVSDIHDPISVDSWHFGDHVISCSATFRSAFECVQLFGSWVNTCRGADVPHQPQQC